MKEKSAKALQSEKTVARTLEAATRLFVTRGYHGTSIAAIAEATHLTKGALYTHFEGKRHLLLALIKEFEARFLERMIEVVQAEPGGPAAQLHRFVSFASEFAEQNRELCLLLTTISAELSDADPDLEREFRRLYAKYARFLRLLIERGKAEGVFDPDLDAHTLAYVIIAFHDGILLVWQRSRDLLDGHDYVRTFRQMVFNGVNPRTAGAKKTPARRPRKPPPAQAAR